MLDNLISFFKKMGKKEDGTELLPASNSGDAAKERLHLVLMQDRANVSVDFMDMMKQEILDVTKKYVDIDEKEMDVRLTNQINEDGSNGAPALYVNIPIVAIKSERDRAMGGNINQTQKSAESVAEEEITKVETAVKKSVSRAADPEKATVTKKRTTAAASASTAGKTAKKVDKIENKEENNEKQITRTKKTVTKKRSVSEE